jgi:hypothetical protein
LSPLEPLLPSLKARIYCDAPDAEAAAVRLHSVTRSSMGTLSGIVDRALEPGAQTAEAADNLCWRPWRFGEKRTSCALFKSRVRHMSVRAPDESSACSD